MMMIASFLFPRPLTFPRRQEKFRTIQGEVHASFGAELQYLTHVVPELWELWNLDKSDGNIGAANGLVAQQLRGQQVGGAV